MKVSTMARKWVGLGWPTIERKGMGLISFLNLFLIQRKYYTMAGKRVGWGWAGLTLKYIFAVIFIKLKI